MEHKKSSEGVEAQRTGQKRWEHAYHLSDLQVVYRRGHWNSWDEMIHWVETQGEKDNELTPGETEAIAEDLRSLRDGGIPFTNDPRKAFELVSEHGVGEQKGR